MHHAGSIEEEGRKGKRKTLRVKMKINYIQELISKTLLTFEHHVHVLVEHPVPIITFSG